MDFKGRALFNALRINYRDGILSTAEPWQVENYRELDEETLFGRLAFLDIHLDEESFSLYIESCASPEELTECLVSEEFAHEQEQQAYLLIFELWRRFGREKQSLSLFCDELDHVIEEYEDGVEGAREHLFEILEALEDILDESVDQGNDPKEAFQFVKLHCCHDLEAFLYTFTSSQITSGHKTYPSELIDSFAAYFENPLWLDLLRIRLVETIDALPMLDRFLESLEEHPNFQLYVEALKFLSYVGDNELFIDTFQQALTVLRKEEQLDELLEVAFDYFHMMELPSAEQKVKQLIDTRGGVAPDDEVDTASETYHRLLELITTTVPPVGQSVPSLPQHSDS